jgi:hypothetical protein
MAIAAAPFCYGHANQPISAQARYAVGEKSWNAGLKVVRVDRGKLTGTGAHSYRVGDR